MATTAKNKNTIPTLADALADARTRLAEARELLARREGEHAQAEEAAEELRDRLDIGDETVSVSDMATADLAADRAKRLIPSARKALAEAERAVDLADAQANPTLAEWLREIIEKNVFDFGLYGFPISVVPQPPVEPEVPAVYLWQSEPTRADRSTGILAGTVHMSIVVPMGAPFTGDQVRKALAELIDQKGMADVTVMFNNRPDGCGIRLMLSDVRPQLPTITPEEPSTSTVAEVAFNVAKAMVRAGGQRTIRDKWVGDMITGMNPGTGTAVNSVNVYVASHDLASQTRDGDLITRTVQATFEVSGHDGLDALADRTRETVANQVDAFVPGVGRVKSAEVTGVELAPGDRAKRIAPHAKVKATFVLISKAAA
ncbi:hypothetical protein O7600_11830 [Micromonospora sp. WMMA1998]|uniref:hypothetical protein n=1 Tax=Micromonospora sp. WMMA1998 TaxID=3015167 RepID=UPI00248D32D5|nr:hypothetical protein [Micromonospora sp. WMMA1998]WBC17470.1 hypothetical protein O7600_11830 [Micromonospora sp. WMMA1998]